MDAVTPTTDAGTDAAVVPVSDLPGRAFLFLGVQADTALVMRGGQTQMIVTVQAAAEATVGTEFGWSWQADSTTAVAVDPCAVRDGDGVGANPGVVSGQVTLSGATSSLPESPTQAWSELATKTKTALLAGQALDAGSVFEGSEVSIGAALSGELQCAYGVDGAFGAAGEFDGAALVGTEPDVNGWWLALSSLIPSP
jgi:hypothetical protein